MEIIVASNADWGIGLHGRQSIVISEDRRRFRKLTTGGVVVVGRKTLADFPGGVPLPGRTNIILTHDHAFESGVALRVCSLRELARALRDIAQKRVFVIGGGTVYRLLLPYCSLAHVTRICAVPESDTFFPNLDEMPGWILRERSEKQSHGDITYTFDIYENTAPADIMEAQHV